MNRQKAHFSFSGFSRLLVSLFLFSGLYLPLVCAFQAKSALLTGLLCGFGCILVLWLLNTLLFRRWLMAASVAGLLLVQLLLPAQGLIGIAVEAVKAITLFVNGAEATATVFARPIALLLGVGLALLSYLFTHPAAGFMPATVSMVLMFYASWSFSKGDFLWLAVPGLIALLLLVSRTSHRRGNVLEVLPVAAVVVVLSMLLLPKGPTVITPMYNAAMNLKQAIEDYLFFTDAREVFSIGDYGWYPIGSGQLGGTVEVEETPVLMVKSDQKVLLRGISKDEYTGRSWRDNNGGKRYLYVSPRWSRLRRQVFLENLPPLAARSATELLQEKAVSVQVQSTGTSTLPVPAYLRSFTASGDMVTYFNDAAELFITRNLQRDDFYTAFAPVLEGGGSELGAVIEAVSNNTADADYPQIYEMYTALPPHLESKVYEDAAKMVAGYNTPYDRACAIARNLQRYYKYTESPGTPPENQDFVTHFLYVGKAGYSTYFASAMAVLCRMNGIPARYVEGFVARPAVDGMCYVTAKDARAWVEVYFQGFGWVPFDPTPAQNEEEQQDQTEPPPTPTPPPPPQEEPQPTPPPPEGLPEEEPPQSPETNSSLWWLLLAAVAVAALAVRIALTSPGHVAAKQAGHPEKVMVYAAACTKLLALRGIAPKKSESALRFAHRVDQQSVSSTRLAPLYQMISISRYSKMGLNAKASEMAAQLYRSFRKDQPLWHRLRYALLCAFTGKGYQALDMTLKKVPVTVQYPAVCYNPTTKSRKKKNHTAEPMDFRPPADYVAPKARTAQEIAAETAEQEPKSAVKPTAFAAADESDRLPTRRRRS